MYFTFRNSGNDILTEKRVEAVREELIRSTNFYINYPDRFIDLITPEDSKFRLFFYQRIFLRSVFRYRYVYAVFTRSFSKSFLSILGLYLRCIFFPGSKVFICADVKEQAARIATEKIREIWDLFPLLKSEMSQR